MKAERISRRTFTLVICIILIITVMASTVVASASESLPLYCTARVVNATKLNLRREPQGEVIGQLATDKTVTILSEIDRNGYYHVRVDETGLECYAYGEYLAFVSYGTTNTPVVVPPFTYEPDEDYTEPEYDSSENAYYSGATLVVTSDKKLNLRKRPSRKGYRLKYLYNGELLEVVSTKVENGYIRVKDLSDGTIGYVSTDYVALLGNEDFYYSEDCTCNCNCISCYCNK